MTQSAGSVTQWLLPTEAYPWAVAEAPALDLELNWMSSCTPSLSSLDFGAAYPQRRIGIRTNIEFFTSLQQNPLYAGAVESWEVNVWFAKFFPALFRPSPRVQALADGVLRAMKQEPTACLQARVLGNKWPLPQTLSKDHLELETEADFEAPSLLALGTTLQRLNASQQLLVASDYEEVLLAPVACSDRLVPGLLVSGQDVDGRLPLAAGWMQLTCWRQVAETARLFFEGKILKVDGPIAHMDKRFLSALTLATRFSHVREIDCSADIDCGCIAGTRTPTTCSCKGWTVQWQSSSHSASASPSC